MPFALTVVSHADHGCVTSWVFFERVASKLEKVVSFAPKGAPFWFAPESFLLLVEGMYLFALQPKGSTFLNFNRKGATFELQHGKVSSFASTVVPLGFLRRLSVVRTSLL